MKIKYLTALLAILLMAGLLIGCSSDEEAADEERYVAVIHR